MDVNFDETLKVLENKVDKLSGSKSTQKTSMFSFKSMNLGISKKYLVYILVPLVILILLVFFKPKMVREDVIDDEGEIAEKKLSIKRVLIATIFFSILVIFGIFLVKNKKK